jgi:hypothetical protein
VGDETSGTVIRDIVVDTKVRREVTDTILILDLDNAKMLTLDPQTKGALYMDIQGYLTEGTKCFLELVREVVNKIQDNPNMPIQELGERKIDGLDAVGFHVSERHMELTIWADSKTARPIRIEILQGQTQYIIKNIEFDVPVDESLVSMEVPAGYTLQKEEMGLSNFSEEDFVVLLGTWAEHVLNGQFPDSVSLEELMKLPPVFTQKIGELNLSEEENMKLGMGFGRGMIFFQRLIAMGNDWYYAGAGVKFGDGDTPVFWYQPKDSQTYRVIYGDLRVEDVAEENLPQ